MDHDIESRLDPDLDEAEDGEIILDVDLVEYAGEEIGVELVTGVSLGEESAPISPSPMGETIVEPVCAALTVEEPSYAKDLALVRVDLAEVIQGSMHDLELGSSLLLSSNQEEPVSWPLVMEHQSEVV